MLRHRLTLLLLLLLPAGCLLASDPPPDTAASSQTADAAGAAETAPSGAQEQAAAEPESQTETKSRTESESQPEPEAGAETTGDMAAETGAAKQADAKEAKKESAEQARQRAKIDCHDGAVLDDGTVETGYGFVPSAKWGMVVQRFESSQLKSRQIERVCVCWLRSREVDELDFEVVFFEDEGGRPAEEPYAAVAGHAADVPDGVDNAGRFYPVEIDDVTLPEGSSFIGVRWNPSLGKFLYVCSNKSEESPQILGFQREDRAKGWDNMLQSRDSLFHNHRSTLLRATAKPAAEPSAENGESE